MLCWLPWWSNNNGSLSDSDCGSRPSPLPISNCQFQIANCKLPIANCQLQIANCQLEIANFQLQISYLLSQQPNVNREQTVRFTSVGLNKIQCFVDCHGDPTTMGLYLILIVAHVPCHCQLQIENCQFQIANCQLPISNCQFQLKIANCKLSIVNCKLPIVNCQL